MTTTNLPYFARLGDHSFLVMVNNAGTVTLPSDTDPLEDGVWNLFRYEGGSLAGTFEVKDGVFSSAQRMKATVMTPDAVSDSVRATHAFRFAHKLQEGLDASEYIIRRLDGQAIEICPNCGQDHVEVGTLSLGITAETFLQVELAQFRTALTCLEIEKTLVNLLQAPDGDLEAATGYKSRAEALDHLLRIRRVLTWQPASDTDASDGPTPDAPAATKGEGAQQ